MKVALGVVNGCFATGMSAVIDILSTASFLQAAERPAVGLTGLHPPRGPSAADGPSIGRGEPIEVRVLGAAHHVTAHHVTASNGMQIPTQGGFEELADADVVVVPALGALDERQLLDCLATPDVRALVSALQGLRPRATPRTIAGACSGPFVLAEAGLLDDHEATTSWWLGRLFRSRYRNVGLTVDRMVVRDGDVITAGAAFAHVDLALALVATISTGLAEQVARFLVIDDRPTQSAYLGIDHLAAHDGLVVEFDALVRANLADGQDIEAIARQLGTTRRTLERRIADALGMSPLKAVQRRRVERARHLMATTNDSMDRIAAQVGYRNASTLRALLRRYS